MCDSTARTAMGLNNNRKLGARNWFLEPAGLSAYDLIFQVTNHDLIFQVTGGPGLHSFVKYFNRMKYLVLMQQVCIILPLRPVLSAFGPTTLLKS